ncbi:MAG TPA: serine hydrolase domain-containing protein [bacterium]|nr:serine hydrolase domain-containing protein [bacterium]
MKLSKGARALLVLFYLVPLFGCGSGEGSLSPELEASLREIVEQKKAEFGIPGVMAGVWIPGEGELIIENGLSDIASGTPIQREDHFRIGSITKSFTVTVILQLAEEGRLSLSDPVEQYLPGIENGTATLAQLADMTSGIFNYTEDAGFVAEFVADFLRKWQAQELIDVADSNAPYFPPGENWHYSNTNTVILGVIVEQVTGRPVGQEIQERILNPLGLNGTLYPTGPDLPSPFVHGYGFDPLEDLSFADPSSSAGSGAMISTLDDLRKWGEGLGTGATLSPATFSQRLDSLRPIVFSPCADNDPQRPKRECPEYDRYGQGMGELNGWIGHTGEFVGYTMLVMYEPNRGSVVVILANIFGVGEHVPTKIFREFAAILPQ